MKNVYYHLTIISNNFSIRSSHQLIFSHFTQFSLLLLVLCAFICKSEEYVGSRIIEDTKWNAADGPYIMDRDLVIEPGISLTINPGVRVIIRKPKIYDTSKQYDATDSQLVSITVKGALNCVGKKNNFISFITTNSDPGSYGWYGFVFQNSLDAFCEIAYTKIVNAYRAITIRECSPVIRNSIIEYNHIGIYCSVNGNGRIYNNVITGNFLSGIHIREANPHIANNIIVFNKNNGVLCDGKSQINFKYNCLFGNTDGDFLDCSPELGVPVKKSKKSSLISDYADNIYMDPVFKGSAADSLAEKHDISLPTRKSDVNDTSIANVYYENDSVKLSRPKAPAVTNKFELSSYSPCIGSGSPEKQFRNTDSTRNTMGIWGGPEFFVAIAKSSKIPEKAAAHGSSSGHKKAPEKKTEAKKKGGGHH